MDFEQAGEDWCPVVNVTWYDAWNFASWLGDHVYLPSELQWEHACRKGTAWDYYFEGGEEELGEARLVWREQRRSDASAAWGGIVPRIGTRMAFTTCWETCGSGAEIGTMRRPRRVCSAAVAGSTTAGTAGRRSATGTSRTIGYLSIGFRLAAVPAGSQVKQVRQSVGDVAASVAESERADASGDAASRGGVAGAVRRGGPPPRA